MNTIFDHNPTEAELTEILGEFDISKDEYTESLSTDSALAALWKLHMIRGDNAQARLCLDKIESESFKQQFVITPCLAAGAALNAQQSSPVNQMAA
jgi:hypothetical protein